MREVLLSLVALKGRWRGTLLFGAFWLVLMPVALAIRVHDALRSLGPKTSVRIEPFDIAVAPVFVAGFAAPEPVRWGPAAPDAIRNGFLSPRGAGFAHSAASLFEPGHEALPDLQLYFTRLAGSRPWEKGSGALREIENEMSDRFPDAETRIQLRLDLPPAVFDDLVQKIGALAPRAEGAVLFLAIGVESPPFAMPSPRRSLAGRAPPGAFERELDVSRLHFELGTVAGASETPRRFNRALAWTTIETRA